MILLALNELNIDYVKGYIAEGRLPNFKELLKNGVVKTKSEERYELLEPWIQWVTVHTGKAFLEHNVFRLGDIVDRADLKQIFEELEEEGLSVGAISPFNADNRLSKGLFFIPDPWTQTRVSGGYIVKKLGRTVSRLVNTNASGEVSYTDLMWMLLGFLTCVRLKKWPSFFNLLSLRRKPGVKAAILDMFLLEVFVTLQMKFKPNYSHLFFNGGAHIQHHYMFNSTQYSGDLKNPEWYCPENWDPLCMILEVYDDIIGDLLKSGERVIGITGLHQVPHEEKTYYWRPISHKDFLVECGLKVEFEVIPRMSRDFLINVSSRKEAAEIESHLSQFTDSLRMEPVFEIDNRGNSLFVEVIYDGDILDDMSFFGPNGICVKSLREKLVFVAIKNGKHNGEGYIFSNTSMDLADMMHLTEVHDFVKQCAISDARITKSIPSEGRKH